MKKNKLAAIFAFICILCIGPVHGREIEFVLVPPQKTVAPGQEALIIVYFNNLSSSPVSIEPYNTLFFTLVSKDKKINIKASSMENALVQVPAGGFVKRFYLLEIPQGMDGELKVSLAEQVSNQGFFYVERASAEAVAGEQLSIKDAETIFHAFAKNFSAYEPMYFLFGVDPGIEKTSFQISFKYRFFSGDGLALQAAPWLRGFHLAYTQKSIWDLSSDSAPFEDTSYKPELFYLADKIDLGLSRVAVFGIQTGYQHESNGQGGESSRSTNHLYIKPILGFSLWEDYFLKFAPKTWVYVNNSDEDNPDLADYRGYFEMETALGRTEGVVLGWRFWSADKGSSSQLDLSYPLNRLLGKSLNLYLHAQYFNGYAETLLNYNEKEEAFRLGFSIVR